MSNTDQMDRVWPIITNREAIAIDHAWAGSPGALHKTLQNGTVEVWIKPLPAHKIAVLVLNAGLADTVVHLSLEDDVPGSPRAARDVWDHKDLSVPSSLVIPLVLPVHDSALLVLSQQQQLGMMKMDDGVTTVSTTTIDNSRPRRDVRGNIVNAHDGMVFRHPTNGRFYLVGTSYTKCYMNETSECWGTDPQRSSPRFVSQTPVDVPNSPFCGCK
jgi:hypothetical protein